MSANGEISNAEANGGAPPHHHHGGQGGHQGGPSNGGPPPLTNDQRNAFTLIKGILAQYGLQDLAHLVLGYVKSGYDSDAINVLIQQTPEWHKRFAGNDIRAKNGLQPLDPGTYLATEAAYRQALQQSGLPQGFYDGGQDFAGWIGGDVSPTEVQQRAQEASQYVKDNADPAKLQALEHYYGITPGHVAAFFMDQKRALPILQQMEAAANIGGAAIRNGLSVDEARARGFAQQGVTDAQAQAGYQHIAGALPAIKTLSDIYHQAFGQSDLEDVYLGQNGSKALKLQKLTNAEQAAFAGTGGAGSTLQDPGYGVAHPTAGQF